MSGVIIVDSYRFFERMRDAGMTEPLAVAVVITVTCGLTLI